MRACRLPDNTHPFASVCDDHPAHEHSPTPRRRTSHRPNAGSPRPSLLHTAEGEGAETRDARKVRPVSHSGGSGGSAAACSGLMGPLWVAQPHPPCPGCVTWSSSTAANTLTSPSALSSSRRRCGSCSVGTMVSRLHRRARGSGGSSSRVEGRAFAGQQLASGLCALYRSCQDTREVRGRE